MVPIKTHQTAVIQQAMEGRRNTASVSDADRVLDALTIIGSKLRIGENQTLFSEGDRADHAYKIVSGVMRLCKNFPDGRRQIAQFLFPGDYLSFIKLAEHSFCAEAVVDVELLSFPQVQLEQLCERHPDLRGRLFQMASGRIRDIQNHLTIVGRQTAKERVASFLLLLSERLASNSSVFDVPMSRQDIADYLGLTMETVSRILSQFRAKRIVASPDLHRLKILDFEALRALADSVE
jgi:CRP/FNR family transcriptional regulator